jgi:hypothetical protein
MWDRAYKAFWGFCAGLCFVSFRVYLVNVPDGVLGRVG